jgi:hypothetical protein
MRKSFVFFIAVFLFLAIFAWAEGTQTWRQSRFEEFQKGTSNGVALRSDGTLELAPAFRPIYTSPSSYIWAIAPGPQGSVYAAAGSPARVYRVTPDGRSMVIFQPQELQVQALIADRQGVLYAATSPDGKVYRIAPKPAEAPAATPRRKSVPAANPQATSANDNQPQYDVSVFFDPKTKYIWDLALDGDGRLYVATGDHGEIYRVENSGQGSVFFRSDEAHIRVLKFDLKGNLIAGSDGSGLIYRIAPTGQAFVLYSAPRKEITALVLDHNGDIFAAGAGEKRSSQTAGILPTSASPSPSSSGTSSAGASSSSTLAGNAPGAPAGGSEIYMITPEGVPRRVWTSKDDLVYALAFDSGGRLLAGTGNRGHVFAIALDGSFTDLVRASANQITAFAAAPNGGLYLSTSNLGKIALIGAGPEADGSYDSDVFDARVFSKWGRAEVRGSGAFDLYARSGNVDNPDRNWSPWVKVDLRKDAPLGVPMARFVQWRVVLHPGNTAATIEDVAINYRPNNVPPEVDDVAVQVGARFQAMPRPSADNAPMTIGSNSSSAAPTPRLDLTPPAVHDHDSIAVRWSAHDDNDDQLVFSIYYRGDGESRWKLLKDKLTDRYYSWDAGLLPDGGYTLKVVASDAPSHSLNEALTGDRESERFEVDRTPPVVEGLAVRFENGRAHITFRGSDNFSPIKRAEYSVDAGDWQFVEPVGQLSDSRTENYDFTAPLVAVKRAEVTDNADLAPGGDHGSSPPPPSTAEHVVVVRVYDRYDNMGTAKFVFRVPQ